MRSGDWRAACRAAALLATVPLLAGCGLLGGPDASAEGDDGDQPGLRPARSSRASTPATVSGRPPIYWSGAPPGTKSLALVVDDADAPITPYIYWIVLDISPATTDIQSARCRPARVKPTIAAASRAMRPRARFMAAINIALRFTH